MALVVAVLLCMLAAGSLAVDMNGDTEIRTALSLNDPCNTADGQSESCTLSALQLKGETSWQKSGEVDGMFSFLRELDDLYLVGESRTDEAANMTLHSSLGFGSVCHGYWSMKLARMAPSCLSSCPELCSPLDSAITSYLTKGGAPALNRVLCHYSHQYGCAIDHKNYRKCSGLINKAGGFGIQLPRSSRGLHILCRR
eukprot:TRINITY_DN50739_c0_g1_i1.p1 TRINITY_DN50739_c0_g1~~TRINITY_DN50739_c0_g1_i1.p1  ORF type:complete len:214 (-),score=26.06 TRINITY_DN50739_c0_g1_i1:45-638(-)